LTEQELEELRRYEEE